MTPEGKIKQKVKAYLDEIGAYWFMPVQGGYGARTVDFLVCYKGNFFGIETKAEGKKPTKLQEFCMRKICKAGGECFVVCDDASFEGLKKGLEIYKKMWFASTYIQPPRWSDGL